MKVMLAFGLSALLIAGSTAGADRKAEDSDFRRLPTSVNLRNQPSSTAAGEKQDASTSSVQGAVAAGEEINWQVLSGGGGRATSASYILVSAIGQTAVGPAASASYGLNSGFIQNFTSGSGGCCIGNTGDLNGDGVDADPIDLSYLVDLLFAGGPLAVCSEEGDINGDTVSSDPIDLSYLVDALFAGGPGSVPCL